MIHPSRSDAHPASARKVLGIQEGDTLFFRREGATLCYAKAENPFDALAAHAIREHRSGRTKSLREIAARDKIDLDA